MPSEWLGPRRESLIDALTYHDLGVGHQLRGWQKARKQEEQKPGTHWFVRQNGVDALNALIAELETQYTKTALFSDNEGEWTYSGFASDYNAPKLFDIPPPKPIKFAHILKHEPRYYQLEAVDKLIAAQHGAVELPTGSGKSLCIALLLQRIGLPATIVAPTLSIAEQLYLDLVELFTTKMVGRFYGGKKEPDRQFVVAVTNSIALVDEGSPLYSKFAARPVLIVDESHLAPVQMLESICMRLTGAAPYRFFLSGTQLRQDGLDLVLRGVIGDILVTKTVRELVDQEFLARPNFYQIETTADTTKGLPGDPIKLNRLCLQKNPTVYRQAGKVINRALDSRERVLVLIDQVEQFERLYKYLPRGAVRFAHGGVNAGNKDSVPPEFHKSKPNNLVKAFDAGEFPVLVGTSCIGMGTDTRSPTTILDIVGGKSETRIRQGVGRGLRLFEGKTEFKYFEFDVTNIDLLHRHAGVRAKIYSSIYAPPQRIQVRA